MVENKLELALRGGEGRSFVLPAPRGWYCNGQVARSSARGLRSAESLHEIAPFIAGSFPLETLFWECYSSTVAFSPFSTPARLSVNTGVAAVIGRFPRRVFGNVQIGPTSTNSRSPRP